MRQLLTLTVTDLKQRVRDKSVLIFAILVPLALMYVFNIVFGSMDDQEFDPVTVAVAVPADDELAGTLVEVVRGLDGSAGSDGGSGGPVEAGEGAAPQLDVSVEEVEAEQAAEVARTMVEDGDAAIALVVPDGFGESVRSGTAVEVEAIRGDEAGLEADIVLSVVDSVLGQFAASAVTARAGVASGIPPEEAGALAQRALSEGPAYELIQGEAASEQLGPGESLVAGQAGLFLMFTVSFGVTSLLVDRETGTLTRLRSMPMRPWYIVVAKALVSFILGVVSTSVLLTVGGYMFDADFGSPLAVAVLVLSVCAAATSVMFLIVRVARTSEQASIATTIVALVLGIGGGAFMPISASGALSTALDLNPVAALLRGLGITSAGGGVADLGVPVAIMLGFAAVMFGLSRLVPDRGALA